MKPGERDAANVKAIHQALQTVAMLHTYKIATGKLKIAVICAIAAVISALASWAAIIVGILYK